MKYSTILSLFIVLAILNSGCTHKRSEQAETETGSWKVISLEDLSGFKPATENWQIVGGVSCDTSERWDMQTTAGTGILANEIIEGERHNIFSHFDHDDIELELEVLMPRGSNSGVYLQSRYEVQLLDSWAVEQPRHSHMGGIYQRWDEALPEGKQGFDGVAPLKNAALPPGEWQTLQIIFRAPVFDTGGNKTKNALFERVILNGQIVQQNVEATGPTRASAANDEVRSAPFMFQGDHGPVAFRNIRYRLL